MANNKTTPVDLSKAITEDELRARIQAEVDSVGHGGNVHVSRKLEVDQTMLHKFLKGMKGAPSALIEALGLRKLVVFVPAGKKR